MPGTESVYFMFLPEQFGVELPKIPLPPSPEKVKSHYFYLIFLGALKKFSPAKALEFSSDHISSSGLSG